MNLNNQISSSLQTRVAILDAKTSKVLFLSASPMRVSISREKRPTKFAVEDGSDRSDHVVTELAEVVVDFILTEDTRNAFMELKQAYEENRLLTVQTKVDTVSNVLIIGLPTEENARLGTSVAVPVRFQEWVEVKPETGELPPSKVEKKKQSSTVKRGTVKGTETPEEKKSSVAAQVYDGWFK